MGVIQIFLGYGLLRVESARAGEFAVSLLKLSLRLVRRSAGRFEVCLERCLIDDEKRLAASDEFAFLIKLPLQDAAHLRADLGLTHHFMPLGNIFGSYSKRSDRHRLCRSLCVGLFRAAKDANGGESCGQDDFVPLSGHDEPLRAFFKA